jgi:conjugal transfer pilus assembly protein TraF
MTIVLPAVVFAMLFTTALYAGDLSSSPAVTDGKTYYGDPKRGWWWYEKIPEKKKEEEKKTAENPERSPRLADYTMERLWDMHPDDFQALLMAFQKKAVQSPSEENVKEYYTIQDIARRKSLAFANATAAVMQKYPELSLAADSPITAPGRNAVVMQQTGEIESKIRNASGEFALLYFYSPGCPYCTEQEAILGYFSEKYHWEIKAINTESDPGTSSLFGIETTPTLLLVYRGSKDQIAVSTGVASMAEIEEKLYRGIRLLKNEIMPEEYSLYEFQRGGAFDVKAPLRREKR